ncbi:hypothetical protein [Streptomyces sp. NPDC090798]|uniref:hypothetical protein n=1 Tax=Streptomyces sp. NPDC090798 TaxID=3365968 RepID=UPI003816574B
MLVYVAVTAAVMAETIRIEISWPTLFLKVLRAGAGPVMEISVLRQNSGSTAWHR